MNARSSMRPPQAPGVAGALATARGFTLMELMVVIAIMGIMLAMGIPTLYHAWHREPMAKAVNDVQEVCSNARARAILQGTMTEVLFHPREGRLEVAGAAPVAPQPDPGSAPPEDAPPPAPPRSGLSAQISDALVIEMLDVNLTEYKDAEIARVRFYPNGTADEMTLILHQQTDKNEWCKISLEVTTGLTSVEFDPRLFK